MTIPLVFFSFMSFAQKKFVVEYDRIQDQVSFYELSYNKGEYSERKMDKTPVLGRGDVVKFRTLNTNPFVFSFQVDKLEKMGEKENVTKSILSGFGGVMGEMDGAISAVGSELNSLGGWGGGPEAVQFGRGTENISFAKKASLEQLSTFRENLKWTYQQLATYQQSMMDVYAMGKTKNQILDGLDNSMDNFKMDDYMDKLRFMEEEYEIIKADPLLADVDFSDLEKTYELLNTKLNESLMAPQNAKDLRNMVAAVSFEEETTTVISYDKGWSGGAELKEIDGDVGSLKYVFDYRSLEEADENYEDDNLIQSKTIELPVKSKSHFSWSTGFYSVNPMNGFNSYRIQEVDYDSVRLVNDDSESSRLTLGTCLSYNFPSRYFLVPQLLFGTSIAFLGSGWSIIKPINFHVGAGLKFKKFPYISIVGGLAFAQNQLLRNGITENETFSPQSSYPEIDEFVERTFSTGYFFGININL